MRILMLVFNQRGRGTYWRAFHLAKECVRAGHQVDLLATSPRTQWRRQLEAKGGLRIVESPDLLPGSLRSGWDLWNILSRLGWLRGKSYDVIHAYETRPVNLLPALAARRSGGLLVFDWADWFGRGGSVEERTNPIVRTLVRPIDTFFEDRFRTLPDGTTVINSFLWARAVELGVSPEKLCLLRNGSDPSYTPAPISAARAHLGLPEGVPILGFVGGTYPRDAQFMAGAFNLVQDTKAETRLLLVGYFNRPIENWINYPAAVIRTGHLPMARVYPYLSACDLGWLPLSDSGANRGRWPYKINDYMTVGRPIVATDVGDLESVILDHKMGVTTAANPREFASATLKLLEQGDRRAELGRAARKAAEGPFSWNVLGEKLLAFYKGLIASHPHRAV